MHPFINRYTQYAPTLAWLAKKYARYAPSLKNPKILILHPVYTHFTHYTSNSLAILVKK